MNYRLLVPLLLMVAGCRNYNPALPEVEVPTAWKGEFHEERVGVVGDRFWELFNDPVLNQLEEEAIAGNFDLQIAAARILEAKAYVKQEHSRRLPKADLNGTGTVDEMLLNPPSFGSPTHHLERVRQPQYSLLSQFSYEADLWGRLKDKEKSAKMRAVASSWERKFVYQTVVTDVALHYFMFRTIEAEVGFLSHVIDLWKSTVHLHETRVSAGLSSEVELARARLELALAEGQIEQMRHELHIQENVLATLLGKPASSWRVAPGTLPSTIPPLPELLPSELLLRRADIQSALSVVSAGRYDVNAALKSYFPSFPLTASLGLASPLLSHFFEWQARYWGFALTALQPLFDGGRRKGEIEEAKARFAERFATYQKTVVVAFKDVEDALSGLTAIRLQTEAQLRADAASKDTFSFAKAQFDQGLISYLLVADAEQTAISVERKTIALRGEQLMSWVRLIKALGLQRD